MSSTEHLAGGLPHFMTCQSPVKPLLECEHDTQGEFAVEGGSRKSEDDALPLIKGRTSELTQSQMEERALLSQLRLRPP